MAHYFLQFTFIPVCCWMLLLFDVVTNSDVASSDVIFSSHVVTNSDVVASVASTWCDYV